ncbi:ribonuclease R [Aromatoleum evansii]|uniref:ribonuclease R n=1 Tax=Aromatoleum evansii TaxID=59406 RepID=UPI00145F04A9|nr:ribonuclease R [Aromatoleum evansii]NMG30810.1 ribonuclease R [Aromatoleum evansii]
MKKQKTKSDSNSRGSAARKPGSGRVPAPSAIRRADPFYAREAAEYEHPLPSREYVVQVLADKGVPLSFEALCAALDVRSDEAVLFERRLRAMERDGQLMRNRRDAYLLPDKADLIRGRVSGHADGFGFIIREDGQPDIFLGPKEMREVLHGDRVIARITGVDRRGRPEGKVVEVLERANTRIVGRVLDQHGVQVVVPENRRIAQDILVAAGGKRARPGQIVTAELVQQPTKFTQPIGRIVEVLGNYADPGMEIEIALRKHELPFEFSPEAKVETRKLPAKVRKMDWAGREDITQLPLVTIDGETAKDFDDAVYCERQGRGYRLVVAIADVSHYVQPGSALDVEAQERGNSVYFPRRVIPMLPEKLSNGLCSLNPQVERLCMVCDMSIGPTGEIKAYRFYPAVMFSHARLTYTQVAAALYDKDVAARELVGGLLPHLEDLDKLFRVLLKARAKRGAIDFETTETRMIFDADGKIERIVPEVRNDAHRLIEECMLAANVCASEFLHEREHPALYRVHEGPTPEKLEKLRGFLAEFGLGVGGGDEPKAGDYATLLEKVKDRPDAQLLQTVMLRSLRQAVYSPDNVGHFGLAYEAYTHFTSPIRRYPDLLVHRSIKAALENRTYAAGDWDEIGLHCSATERRADEATRDVVAWLKCYYMQDKVGEEFTGSVSAVVPFGLFVALDDIFIEGLVHISDLGSDYFHFDETRHELAGERTGARFRLSDRVRVQVVRVDLESSKIDFRLIEGAPRATERTGKTAKDRAAAKVPAEVKTVPEAVVAIAAPETAAPKAKGGRKKTVVSAAVLAAPRPAAEPAPQPKAQAGRKAAAPGSAPAQPAVASVRGSKRSAAATTAEAVPAQAVKAAGVTSTADAPVAPVKKARTTRKVVAVAVPEAAAASPDKRARKSPVASDAVVAKPTKAAAAKKAAQPAEPVAPSKAGRTAGAKKARAEVPAPEAKAPETDRAAKASKAPKAGEVPEPKKETAASTRKVKLRG